MRTSERLELPQTRIIDLNKLSHEEAAQGLDVWTIHFRDGPMAGKKCESSKFETWFSVEWPSPNIPYEMERIDAPIQERKRYTYEIIGYDAWTHKIRMKLASPLRAPLLERGLVRPGK